MWRDTIAKQEDTIVKLETFVAALAMALGSRDETTSSWKELCQNVLFQNQLINVPMTLLSAYKAIVNDLALALFFVNPEKGPQLVEYYSKRQRPLIQKALEQLEAYRASLQKSA